MRYALFVIISLRAAVVEGYSLTSVSVVSSRGTLSGTMLADNRYLRSGSGAPTVDFERPEYAPVRFTFERAVHQFVPEASTGVLSGAAFAMLARLNVRARETAVPVGGR